MYPVIVCIAKREHKYIEEFIKYHLYLGFKHIYLYDNEDEPTYEKLLSNYAKDITVIHLPFNNYHKGIQYIALDDFTKKYIHSSNNITHITHIDIDEFIVLKKHNNIEDLINEYIVGDCQGLAMNWRFFGSSGKTEQTDEPVTIRFTKCQKNGDGHIKTIFKKDYFIEWPNTPHYVKFSKGFTKSTNNEIIKGYINNNYSFDVIQLNHYKSKTLPEFIYIRARGDVGVPGPVKENVHENFKIYDRNDIEELSAYNFYKKILDSEKN